MDQPFASIFALMLTIYSTSIPGLEISEQVMAVNQAKQQVNQLTPEKFACVNAPYDLAEGEEPKSADGTDPSPLSSTGSPIPADAFLKQQ